MKIGVLIIEDNPITARDLSEILQENGMEVLSISYSGEEASEVITTIQPDILLVDIKLKGKMTGIEFVLQVQKNQHIPVVYLTANSDRETVQSALDTTPSAFLTKPFEEKDVVIAIELAFKNHLRKTSSENSPSNNPNIFVRCSDRFEKVVIDTIHYLKAEGSYCKIVTNDKEYLLSGNLNHYCHLGHNFLRIHRSYVVNIDNVTGFDSENIILGEKTLPIGRSHRDEIKDAFKKFPKSG